MARREHFNEISKELGTLHEDDRHAVVFIHGYNVSFDQAALRCAQLGADLGLPGITAFFSWRSRGTLRGYIEDEASIEAAERPTLYISARDRAVEASRWLHGFPRVGLEPPLAVTAGIDTISATNVDVTLLGHGYVTECRPVLSDMLALLRNGDPPAKRFGLRTATTPEGSTYWEFRA